VDRALPAQKSALPKDELFADRDPPALDQIGTNRSHGTSGSYVLHHTVIQAPRALQKSFLHFHTPRTASIPPS